MSEKNPIQELVRVFLCDIFKDLAHFLKYLLHKSFMRVEIQYFLDSQ
jgi:hypothetical protein